MSEPTKSAHDDLARALIDNGKLIEAGWLTLRHAAIPANATEAQVYDCRMFFFAGAQHLFASIMGAMEPGSEPTADDERRMENIAEELHAFDVEFRRVMQKILS